VSYDSPPWQRDTFGRPDGMGSNNPSLSLKIFKNEEPSVKLTEAGF